MYEDIYTERITRKLLKLKKRDRRLFEEAMKKIDQIRLAPEHRFKNLRFELKGCQRVHVGHYVLIFIIDNEAKRISFEDFDHHNSIYLR